MGMIPVLQNPESIFPKKLFFKLHIITSYRTSIYKHLFSDLGLENRKDLYML